ncbi:MAG: hypothetical protein KAS32_16060 [Candidatus Peribacteraceae bacterium]|nr:hypothetical protein [Candidatus Peribacteraceae bacterium]
MKNFIKKVIGLELEEKILNIGVLAGMLGILFPWIGGEWLGGETVHYAGFQFYTGYIGIALFFLFGSVLLVTILPLAGSSSFIKKKNKDTFRMLVTSLATILTIASLSVLTKTTREFVRMDLRFGVYITLIGGLVASLYSFLRYQEQKKKEVKDLFHYQEDYEFKNADNQENLNANTLKMSTPKAPEPEQHTIFASASKK